jgi:hypothetical protein
VLRFDAIADKTGDENLAADMQAPLVKPESLVVVVSEGSAE